MPYTSMDAARKAGAKTELGGASLSLTQINKMAEMADAMKAEGKVDNPWAVAVAQFQKGHKIENGRWVMKEAANFKQNIHESISLSEGQVLPDEEGGKKSYKAWWPLLKEGPGNKVAKNYYSKQAIESVVPLTKFKNKMYFGHAEGDVKPTERSVKDWAASVRETKIENGVLYGLVQALDPWLKDRMYDAPGDLAASIEARGKAGKTIDYEGEKWNLIEEVKWLNGFMIVDYPGNAPMGVQLTEADLEGSTDLEDKMENVAELKEKFPEIYNQVVKEIKEADKAEFDKFISAKDAEIKTLKDGTTMDQKTITDLSESVKKMDAKLDGLEALGKKKERDQKVFAEMGKLPKEAITDKFKELVESAKDEKSALEMIEERAKLFEGKVIGHGKSDTKPADQLLKEREALVLHSLGHKTPEEIEAEKKAAEKK